MKQILISIILLLGLAYNSAYAVSVDLTSGTTGTIPNVPQSFNETRAARISVLSPSNLSVSSMTLGNFNIDSGIIGTVGARIYNESGSLLAFADSAVSDGLDQSIIIPISAILVSGESYRVGFFIDAGGSGASGDMFAPDSFPYTETNGLFSITGAFSISSDAFPTNPNIFIHTMMGLEVSAVPIPAAVWLFGSGLLGLIGIARRKRAA